jgi:hypothetical protein
MVCLGKLTIWLSRRARPKILACCEVVLLRKGSAIRSSGSIFLLARDLTYDFLQTEE